MWKLTSFVECFNLYGYYNSGISTLSVEALLGIAAGLIAILIPVSVFLIDKNDTSLIWDKTLILERILSAKRLLAATALLLLPLTLWGHEWLRLPLFLLFCVGVGIYFWSLVKAYKWLRVAESGTPPEETYRLRQRIQYLEGLRDDEKLMIWSLTWQTPRERRAIIEDRKLMKCFIESVSVSPTGGGSDARMIQDLTANITNIQVTDWIVYEQVLVANINWLTNFESKNKKSSKKRAIENIELEAALQDLLRELIHIGLQKVTHVFFATIETGLSDKSEKQKKEFLRDYIAPVYLDALESSEDDNSIWNRFPDKWKITAPLLTSNSWGAPFAWAEWYLNTVTERINDGREQEFDRVLEHTTRYLVPDVDSILWANILIFVCSSYSDSRVQNFISTSKAFGHIGRTFVTEYRSEEEFQKAWRTNREKELEATFELIGALIETASPFAALLTKNEIKKYLREIASLKEQLFNEPEKQDRLRTLEAILKEIQKRSKK